MTLRKARDLYPAKVGVVDGNRSFTYARVGERVNSLARFFQARDIKPQDRISIKDLHTSFNDGLTKEVSPDGFGLDAADLDATGDIGEAIERADRASRAAAPKFRAPTRSCSTNDADEPMECTR